MTTFQWKRLKAVLWTIAAFLVLLWAGKIVVEYFIILLVFLAYFTLLYNIGTLVAASLFHIKVEEISVGLGRRIFGFQFAHVQFNLGLFIFGGSCRLADYSAFPGLNPMNDEFRAAKFLPELLCMPLGV